MKAEKCKEGSSILGKIRDTFKSTHAGFASYHSGPRSSEVPASRVMGGRPKAQGKRGIGEVESRKKLKDTS
jgi:hypothetical protein